jgi:hypothetical protein
MVMDTKLVASVLEEHYHYMYLYEEFLMEKIRRMEFANTKRIQMHLAKSIKENCGRILTFLAILGVIGKVIGYKTLVLILFAINLVQPTQAMKPTTIQSLHNTLLYIKFRINYNWLSSRFGEKQYREMEAGLIDATNQIATPPPKPTSATKIQMFQTNDERIHSILHSVVNKTLNKQAEEKEEAPNASSMTKQQEMIYATEKDRYTSLPIFHKFRFFIIPSHFTFFSKNASVTQGTSYWLE